MNRLGLLFPTELTPSQREAYSVMHKYTITNYGDKFKYLDPEFRLLGPFGIQIHHPEVAKAFIHFATALRTIPDFPHEHTNHSTKDSYALFPVHQLIDHARVIYSAHESLSGFTEEEQQQLHKGSCPDHFSEKQKIAYKVAIELGQPGPLSESIWDETTKILGTHGATALIHYVGFYSYVSTILNGFDGEVPS